MKKVENLFLKSLWWTAHLLKIDMLYWHIFQPILTILVSKFMVHRALSDKIYLLLRLLSPLNKENYFEIYIYTKYDVPCLWLF